VGKARRRARALVALYAAAAIALVSTSLLAASVADAKSVMPEARQQIGKHYYGRFKSRSLRTLGFGCRSSAALVEHNYREFKHLTVLKTVRTVRRDEIKAAGGSEKAAKELYVHRVVGVTEILRKSRRMRRRFGDIVPETISPAPGVMLQRRGEGVPYKRLSEDKRAVAKKEIAELVKIARRVLPGKLAPTKAKKNFLFDPSSGKISSWYDLISDAERHPQPPLQPDALSKRAKRDKKKRRQRKRR
jgi:hypothetical protein